MTTSMTDEPTNDCDWCAYLRSIGATEEYIADQHAWAAEEYGGHNNDE